MATLVLDLIKHRAPLSDIIAPKHHELYTGAPAAGILSISILPLDSETLNEMKIVSPEKRTLNNRALVLSFSVLVKVRFQLKGGSTQEVRRLYSMFLMHLCMVALEAPTLAAVCEAPTCS